MILILKDKSVNNITFFPKSVIVHTGEATNQGHYTLSFIDEHGAWLECDDTHIRKTNLPKKGYFFF